MAKIDQGYMGGFIGKLGPAVGYRWRGKWCMRALPTRVRNPRTAAQQAHRMQFREMVQLAGRFRVAINTGLRQLAYGYGMTECNMFVHRNHRLLTAEGLDYSQLEVSHGPVAPVGFGAAQVDGQMVLRVDFEKNPLRQRADADDSVVLFIYSVDHQFGIRTQAVPRKCGHIEVALPTQWADAELHIYGFVVDRQGRTSNTLYVKQGEPEEAASSAPATEAAGAGVEVRSAVPTEHCETGSLQKQPEPRGTRGSGAPPHLEGAGAGG